MPESNQHYYERNRDYSSQERRAGDRGRDHRPDARYKEERRTHERESQSHRNKERDANTHKDPYTYEGNRHHSQTV